MFFQSIDGKSCFFKVSIENHVFSKYRWKIMFFFKVSMENHVFSKYRWKIMFFKVSIENHVFSKYRWKIMFFQSIDGKSCFFSQFILTTFAHCKWLTCLVRPTMRLVQWLHLSGEEKVLPISKWRALIHNP